MLRQQHHPGRRANFFKAAFICPVGRRIQDFSESAAAFVTPPKKGTHTVGIGGIIGGEDVVFVSMIVTVR
jgi:hypothetical protein